jgi:hypothetical protein
MLHSDSAMLCYTLDVQHFLQPWLTTQLTPNSFFGLSADLTDNRDVTLRMCLARTEGGRVQLGLSWLNVVPSG